MAAFTNFENEIMELLRDNLEGLPLNEIALRLHSTKGSVKVTIHSLRKKGVDISSPRKDSMFGPRKSVPQVYRIDRGDSL